MKGKIVSLKEIMPLVLLVCIAISANTISKVKAQPTVVSILPASVTISNPGETITVDLNITDVVNMYAYEIKIWYLNSILNATEVVRPPGHFMEPSDPTKQFIPKWEIKNNYNATHGRIWIAFTLLAPESAKTGSGILAKITFKGLSVGSTPIILNNYPGTQGPVKLADNTGTPIPHTAQDGLITVIPEFPAMAAIMLMLLLIAAAYALKVIRLKIKGNL